MMKRKIKRKKGPVRAKKVSFDGITFASGLEKYMYIALKKAKIKAVYEGETFVLQEGFMFNVDSKGNLDTNTNIQTKLGWTLGWDDEGINCDPTACADKVTTL